MSSAPLFPGFGPLWLTLKLSGITVIILLALGTPLAWWLARTQSQLKTWVEAMVAMPLVLPPTVLGFYLLILLGPEGPIGRYWIAITGDSLTFSFTGLVLASTLYSMPFAVQPLQNAFESIGRKPIEAARTLGASPTDAFFSIIVPLAAPGFLTAAVLGFAHTLGEFGVVLMIGGNIPGETRVISIAIYDHVESLQYQQAHVMSAILLALSFSVLFMVYGLSRKWRLSIT